MQLGDNTIQRVDWQNVCPVVLLPKAYRLALGFRVILLAFLGLFVTSLLAGAFLTEPSVSDVVTGGLVDTENFGPTSEPIGFVATTTERVIPGYAESQQLGTPKQWHENIMTFSRQESRGASVVVSDQIAHPWMQISAAGREVFSHRNHSLWQSLCWFLIILVIWSCIGGMITRIVALRFAQDRRETLSRLVVFQRKKCLSYIGAIVLPVVGVFCALIPVWLLGWLWSLIAGCFSATTTFGLIAGSVGGFVHLILVFPFALIAVLIMIGFLLGWPLMIAAISAEGSDAFDAVSRGFSYVYQRPVQFVFYHLCNLVIYVVGIMIAYFVFHETIWLIGYNPAGLMIIFNSFAFAYFWSSSTVIYFLLRRSCDATPCDQVFLGEINKRTLPIFGADENGSPELKTGKAEDS